MPDKPAFQEHHIIEKQAFKDSALLKQLSQYGLLNINDSSNLLNMPASPDVASKIGISPHNGGPLSAYSDNLEQALLSLENSDDGQAALRGDKAAAGRVAERINTMRDTMRAGLINGDLFTNTPQGMTPEIAKGKIDALMGDLEGYAKTHAGQIEKIATTTPNRWDAITTAEDRVRAAVDAIEPNGIKASKGPAEIAKNNLGAAIVRSAEAGELALSPGILQHLGRVFSKSATGVAAVSIVADIAVSTAEAKQAAAKGDVEGAHSIMNGLGARLAFGWLGAQWGASLGTGAGIYGAIIGGALGGMAGILGGEGLVRGIDRVANQLTGILNPQGNATTPVKAPEAETLGGNTLITEFDPKDSKPTSVTIYNSRGKVTQQTRPQYDLQTGLKIREEIFDGNGNHTIDRSFAPNTGKLTSEVNYNRTTGKVSTECTYDAQGAKTMKFFDNKDGRLTDAYEYNSAGKITRQLSYSPDGSVSLDSRRSYDAATGKQNAYHQYNSEGRLIHEAFYNPDGKSTGYKSYDNNGILTKDVTINPDTKEVLHDAVAEAKAKAKTEAEWAAAQEAARISAEKQAAADAAAKAEAERLAAQEGGHSGTGEGGGTDGWPGGKIPQPGSPTFEQERDQAGFGSGWIPDWRNPGQWMPDPFAPWDKEDDYTCVGGPGTTINGVPSTLPPTCGRRPFKRSLDQSEHSKVSQTSSVSGARRGNVATPYNSNEMDSSKYVPAASSQRKWPGVSQHATPDLRISGIEGRKFYKQEDARVAELHAKGYGLSAMQEHRRKEWNEWQDPYFAKHPHKAAQVAPVLSPERQRIQDLVTESVARHYARLAEATELAPKSPWQQFVGMFSGNSQSNQDKRAFAEVSQLSAKTPEQMSEATSLLTSGSTNSSFIRL